MLGGCSSINAMIANKGSPDDFDEWERLGNPGWGFKDVEPFMKKAECFHGSTNELSSEEVAQHGKSGPWQIGYSHWSLFGPRFLDACAAQGIPKVRDINSNAGINGATRLQTFIDSKGQRSSAAVAYLTKDVASRSNLKIAVGQTVTRIIFNNDGPNPKAVGVEMASSSGAPVKYIARAKREVLLCAGAVHTPQILKLSGIGPAKELLSHRIELIKDVSAVGANLADHLYSNFVVKVTKGLSLQFMADDLLSLPALIQWLRTGTGPMTSNIAESAAFLRTVDREDAPASLRRNDLSSGKTSADLEILYGPVVFANHGATQPKGKEKKDVCSLWLYLKVVQCLSCAGLCQHRCNHASARVTRHNHFGRPLRFYPTPRRSELPFHPARHRSYGLRPQALQQDCTLDQRILGLVPPYGECRYHGRCQAGPAYPRYQ